ncbi:hypothetical protein NQZ68_015171 [Dissostichus eleginoides]|nr:hypothetical protein NQZ68_015171 [Dissostichus eleginoides]
MASQSPCEIELPQIYLDGYLHLYQLSPGLAGAAFRCAPAALHGITDVRVILCVDLTGISSDVCTEESSCHGKVRVPQCRSHDSSVTDYCNVIRSLMKRKFKGDDSGHKLFSSILEHSKENRDVSVTPEGSPSSQPETQWV